jgi:predicted SnoaL-like aldol condensation-catalyzing enzyme
VDDISVNRRFLLLAVSATFAFAACTTSPTRSFVAGQSVAVVGHPEPLSQLESSDPRLAANKRLVWDLWRGVVNAGHVELADELLTENYVQHSPLLPTGRAAFKQIFSAVPRREQIPTLSEPPLVALVAEGDLVAMAFVEKLPEPGGNGTYTTTHFNLFRVENGRLAEHWHSLQGPPGPDVRRPQEGGPQPVTGISGAGQLALLKAADPKLAYNKRLVFDFSREVLEAGREQAADLYVQKNYIQHNPNMATGREALKTIIAALKDRPIGTSIRRPLVAVVAEGDLVVQAMMLEHPHPGRPGETYTSTWFDMFRVEDGRLGEHWDAAVSQADRTASSWQ